METEYMYIVNGGLFVSIHWAHFNDLVIDNII